MSNARHPRAFTLYLDAQDAAGVCVLCWSEPGDAVEIVSGREQPIPGWISYAKGTKEPAPVLEIRRTASLPAVFTSVLMPFRGSRVPELPAIAVQQTPSLGMKFEVMLDGDSHCIAIEDGRVQLKSTPG